MGTLALVFRRAADELLSAVAELAKSRQDFRYYYLVLETLGEFRYG